MKCLRVRRPAGPELRREDASPADDSNQRMKRRLRKKLKSKSLEYTDWSHQQWLFHVLRVGRTCGRTSQIRRQQITGLPVLSRQTFPHLQTIKHLVAWTQRDTFNPNMLRRIGVYRAPSSLRETWKRGCSSQDRQRLPTWLLILLETRSLCLQMSQMQSANNRLRPNASQAGSLTTLPHHNHPPNATPFPAPPSSSSAASPFPCSFPSCFCSLPTAWDSRPRRCLWRQY